MSFQAALLSWYRANARALPWRSRPSLYKTVVSEFMLQQTQVTTVLPYFERWMTALPDFRSLAVAPEDHVLRLWEGLGYYSRARNLQRLARALVALASPPRTAAEWEELPGVGPYTAAAICSIAFAEPAACVDGNVVRILSRLTADPKIFRDSASAAKHFRPLAQSLLNAGQPGDHNQAMMELGATLCTRRAPRCAECPVRRHCAAAGPRAESFPRLEATPTELVSVTRVWCVRDGALLLYRAPATARRLASQHEIPTADQVGIPDASARRGSHLATLKRSITRYRITESFHIAAPPKRHPGPDFAWVPFNQLQSITLSGPHRRWLPRLMSLDK